METETIRILLVEDDEEDFLITSQLLAGSPGSTYEVEWTDRLDQALRKLKQQTFDVILLDLSLPDSIGWNTFERTRDHAPDVPTILLTGTHDEALGMQAIRRGAQDYLLKGRFDGDRLGRAIRYAIERKRTERSLRRYQDHLEDLVAERTAELSRANAELEKEIAERAAVEVQMREAIGKLEAHDRAKSEFVSNVSHELKTPLSSMSYAIANMIRGVIGPIPERAMDYLYMLKEDSERLKGTVSDILDLSRAEARRLILDRHCISFARLVEQTAASLVLQAEAQQLHLDISTGDDPGFVNGDPHKLERVILNIIVNAIKFTPQKGRIEVAVHRDQAHAGMIVMDVTDTGIGIESRHLSRVTERYFRVGEHVTGAGLGLALSKEIAEMHGGRLCVVSPPPERPNGTRVSLFLPLVPAPTILLATPEQAGSARLFETLRKHGYHVIGRDHHGASDKPPAAGVDADLVLIDLCRPGLEGIEFIAALRAGAAPARTPVLVLTEKNPEPAKASILDGLGLPRLDCRHEEEEALMAALENSLMTPPKG